MDSLLSSTSNTRYLKNISNRSLLIRSDKIDNCSENEIKFLSNLGIKNVIDLRDLSNKKTNPFLAKYGIKLSNCPMPIEKDKQEFLKQYPEGHCFDYYKYLLSNYNRIKDFFEILLSTNGGVLFNCSAGRDRTGVIAFLIELILEHKVDIIVENMAISDHNLMVNNLQKGINTASNLDYDKSKNRALKLYDWFFNKYRTIDNYFDTLFKSHDCYLQIKRKIYELCEND